MNQSLLHSGMALICAATALAATASPMKGKLNQQHSPLATSLTRTAAQTATRAESLNPDDYPIISEPAGEMKHYSRTSSGYGINDWGFLSEANDQGFAQDIVFGEDGKVYMRHPNSLLRLDNYMVGEKEGDKVTFTFPQRMAVMKDSETGEPLDVYLMIMDYVDDEFAEELECVPADNQTITMNFDADGHLIMDLTPQVILGVTFDDGAWAGYGEYYFNCEPMTDVPVSAPEGLKTEIWGAHYEDIGHTFNLGFDGNDVYFQGLYKHMPDAWVKGTIDGDKVLIPSGQYMGLFDYNNHYVYFLGCTTVEEWDELMEDYATYVIAVENFEMAYDAEKKEMDAGDEFCVFNGGLGSFYFISYLMKPVFRFQGEVEPARPVNPEFFEFDSFYPPSDGYPGGASFNLPSVDINGNLLATGRMYYRVYTPQQTVFVFTPEQYPSLPGNITLIPFNFSDDYDFFCEGALHNVTLYDESLTMIGVQSVYEFRDGSQLESDIVYTDGTVVSAGVKGIESVDDGGVERWYNLQGQPVATPERGIFIRVANGKAEKVAL